MEGGFVAGVSLGLVPFGGIGQQVLDAAEVLPHGTPEARRGLAMGQIVGGLITLVGGLTGEVAGGLAATTGIGAAVGVPAVLVSVAPELLLIMTRPLREMKELLRRTEQVLLYEAVDPNKKRRTLLRAVETRTHRYRGSTASVAA